MPPPRSDTKLFQFGRQREAMYGRDSKRKPPRNGARASWCARAPLCRRWQCGELFHDEGNGRHYDGRRRADVEKRIAARAVNHVD
jgi:hypothetical protein